MRRARRWWWTLLLAAPALADLAPMPPDAQPAAVHPEGIENVGMGVVQGGWEYVYAAYGVGLLGVVLYAVSLVVRTKESKT